MDSKAVVGPSSLVGETTVSKALVGPSSLVGETTVSKALKDPLVWWVRPLSPKL